MFFAMLPQGIYIVPIYILIVLLLWPFWVFKENYIEISVYNYTGISIYNDVQMNSLRS